MLYQHIFLMNIGSILAVIFSAVAVVIILAILFFVMHRKKYSKNLSNLKEAYSDVHNNLTTYCSQSIKRLEALSKYNETFLDYYNNRNAQYLELLNKKDAKIAQSLDSLTSLIQNKEFRQVREIENEVSSDLEAYKKSINVFSSDLTTILQEDTDIHSKSVPIKTKYRNIMAFYQEHKDELTVSSQALEFIIQQGETKLVEFNDLIDQAKYEEGRKILDELNTIFDSTTEVLDQIPIFEASVIKVLPQKIDALEENYMAMIKGGYYITNLGIVEKIDEMRSELDQLRVQLSYLETAGIKEKIDDIQNTITEYNAIFENEKRAKEEYSNSQDIVNDSFFKLENTYYSHINNLKKYSETYVLEEKYVNQMVNLKGDIETIDRLKRELDANANNTQACAYSVIMKKIGELKQKILVVDRTIKDFDNYLKSLRNDSQKVAEGLNKCYESLKKLSADVKDLGVDDFSNSLMPKFEHSFERIAKLGKELYNCPLNVKRIYEQYVNINQESEYFIQDVNKKLSDAKKAEELIIALNASRFDFDDCNKYCNLAENSFAKGDYSTALAQAQKGYSIFNNTSKAQ